MSCLEKKGREKSITHAEITDMLLFQSITDECDLPKMCKSTNSMK